MALMDLSGDGLRAILQHLQPKDLCRCKLVCRKLGALASEEMLWEAQSLRWFQRHGKQSGLCNVSPSSLRSQLHHTSFASMYQALHSLGGWPEGLWYRTDSSGQPHGALVWILLRGAVLHVLQIDYAGWQTATFCRIVLDTLPVQVFIDATPKYHVVLEASAIYINSSAGTMVLKLPHSSPDSDSISASLKRENPYNHEVLAQARNLWPYGGPWGSTDEFRSKSPELLRLHHIAPLPSALPNLQAPLAPQLQPAFTAAQALRRVAGLWTASYGGHGPEILHVWFDETLQSHNGAPILEGPNARPRLVGCKVTGDPNVPANQWSFVAQAGEMKQGGWDGRGSWNNEPEDPEYRPIVRFRGLPTLVDMRERQVLARFLCYGCINHTPGDFKPEWVSAQLLLYENPKPMFSVLYDDLDERYRHIMDFEPVGLPCKPSLSWLQGVPLED